MFIAASASPKTGTSVSSRKAETRSPNTQADAIGAAANLPKPRDSDGRNGVARPRRHHRGSPACRRAFEDERIARMRAQAAQHVSVMASVVFGLIARIFIFTSGLVRHEACKLILDCAMLDTILHNLYANRRIPQP